MKTVKQFIKACEKKAGIDTRETSESIYYTAPAGYALRLVSELDGETYVDDIKHIAIFPEMYDTDGDGIFLGLAADEIEVDESQKLGLELLKVVRVV